MSDSPKYTPLQIANTIINYAQQEKKGCSLTPLKLIKLTYFFYAWYLAVSDERPFSELPQAWKYGPVFPSVYTAFSRYGPTNIDDYYVDYDPEDKDKLKIPVLSNEPCDDIARSVVTGVWKRYGKYDAWGLMDITHEEGGPWHKIWDGGRGNRKIIDCDDEIKKRALKAILNRPS